MTKSSKTLLDRLLFHGKGILPTKRFLYIFVIWSFIVLLLSIANVRLLTIVILNIVVIFGSLVDLFFIPKRKNIVFTRELNNDFERDKAYDVRIHVENKSQQNLQFTIVDDLPQSFETDSTISGKVPGSEKETFTYQVKAPVRGDYTLEVLHVRYTSSLGLWAKQLTVPARKNVKVIPDLTEVRAYLQDAQRFLVHEGSKVKRDQVGTGEFASIRSYVIGDDPRMINWHQTAKLQEMMTNVYEPEQGKHISILIDCGRMMGVELKEGNRLERSLEAALTVAAAALQRGDYVAVLAFSKEVHTYIPPNKGIEHLQTILHEIYNLQVQPVESNYQEAFFYLENMLSKRSLLFLFSDVQTFLYNDYLLSQLVRIRQRHLFFLIGIEDEILLERVKERPDEIERAMIKSMAQYQLLSKRRDKNRWEQRGLQLVEAEEENVTATAVSYYIDLMNRGLL